MKSSHPNALWRVHVCTLPSWRLFCRAGILPAQAPSPGFILKHSLLPLHLWLCMYACRKTLKVLHSPCLWACVVMPYWILLVLSSRELFRVAIYCFPSCKYNKIKTENWIRKNNFIMLHNSWVIWHFDFTPWYLRDVLSSFWDISVVQLVYRVSGLLGMSSL